MWLKVNKLGYNTTNNVTEDNHHLKVKKITTAPTGTVGFDLTSDNFA